MRAAAAAGSAAPPSATVTQTSANLSDALASKRPREWVPTPGRGSHVITVNGAIKYQTITGFGAAMTDSSAYLLQDELSPEANTIANQALFGRAGIRPELRADPDGCVGLLGDRCPVHL